MSTLFSPKLHHQPQSDSLDRRHLSWSTLTISLILSSYRIHGNWIATLTGRKKHKVFTTLERFAVELWPLAKLHWQQFVRLLTWKRTSLL